MKKILFVSKDIGGANIAAPLAEEFVRGGHSVTIISEGLASAIFEKRGFSLDFKGSVNFLEEPFTLDAVAVIKKVNPDIICTTDGSPIHLEEEFGLAANRLSIPLIFLEGFWGSFTRSKARPDAMLVLDQYSKELALRVYPEAKVAVVGNPGVIKKDELLSIDTHLLDHLKNNSAKVFLYTGGDPVATSEQLDLLVKCLEKTSGEWRLVVRFHPKWVKVTEAKSKRTFGEIWNEILSLVAGRIVTCDDLSKMEVVVNCDLLMSDYSTFLTTAVIAGKPAITLFTPLVKSSLQGESVVDEVPLVTMGYAHEVKEPCDLSRFEPSKKSLEGLKPYEPKLAYDAIMNFF